MLANYGLIQISRTNAAARQSSPDAAFDPFFSFEERSFKSGSGKQIAMYRRIYSKRKHGAFCIEILQRFQGNRNCSIFAFTDQHVFLEGVSCHNVDFLVFVPPTSDRRSKENAIAHRSSCERDIPYNMLPKRPRQIRRKTVLRHAPTRLQLLKR